MPTEPGRARGTRAPVTFSFDGSALAGRTVVAFETLSLGGREYAAHADLSDEGQAQLEGVHVVPEARPVGEGVAEGEGAGGHRERHREDDETCHIGGDQAADRQSLFDRSESWEAVKNFAHGPP